MKLTIHRGTKEIGGSCVELESGAKRILIDFGLPLDAEKEHTLYIPKIKGLDGKDPSLLGILISHPHLDHFGLLSYVSPEIPVGMGTAARRILEAAAPFLPGDHSLPKKGWEYKSEQTFSIGPFSITPYLVDHSAYDAYSLLVECEGKRIFYSGDFRAHGRKAGLFKRFIKAPPENIDALLLEGSSLGRIDEAGYFPTEDEIETQLREIFSKTEGLAMVHSSAQNIDRVVSIFRASKETGRKIVIDLYTAAILEATGNKNIPQSMWKEVALYVPQSQRVQILKQKRFSLLEKHSSNRIYIDNFQRAPRKSTILFRPLHISDLEKGNCLAGAAYIYSLWEGYWQEKRFDRVKNWLDRCSIPKHNVHTSGHASLKDLQKLAKAIDPEKIIPIHTFHPESYRDYFGENVVQLNDGQVLEL